MPKEFICRIKSADTAEIVRSLQRNPEIFGMRSLIGSEVIVHMVEKDRFCLFIGCADLSDNLCVWFQSHVADSEDLLEASEVLVAQSYLTQKRYRLCFVTETPSLDLFMGVNELFGTINYCVHVLTVKQLEDCCELKIVRVLSSETDSEKWSETERSDYGSPENWVRGQLAYTMAACSSFYGWVTKKPLL